MKEVVGVAHVRIQQWVKWYEAGGIEEVGRHSLGNGARGMDAGARAEGGGGGIGRAVSDDRGGGGVV